MGAETHARLDAVFVDDAQRAETHVGRVVVVAEGKGVAAVEPAQSGLATFRGGPDGVHQWNSRCDMQSPYSRATNVGRLQGPNPVFGKTEHPMAWEPCPWTTTWPTSARSCRWSTMEASPPPRSAWASRSRASARASRASSRRCTRS